MPSLLYWHIKSFKINAKEVNITLSLHVTVKSSINLIPRLWDEHTSSFLFGISDTRNHPTSLKPLQSLAFYTQHSQGSLLPSESLLFKFSPGNLAHSIKKLMLLKALLLGLFCLTFPLPGWPPSHPRHTLMMPKPIALSPRPLYTQGKLSHWI